MDQGRAGGRRTVRCWPEVPNRSPLAFSSKLRAAARLRNGVIRLPTWPRCDRLNTRSLAVCSTGAGYYCLRQPLSCKWSMQCRCIAEASATLRPQESKAGHISFVRHKADRSRSSMLHSCCRPKYLPAPRCFQYPASTYPRPKPDSRQMLRWMLREACRALGC
jgi:hypothetical protein